MADKSPTGNDRSDEPDPPRPKKTKASKQRDGDAPSARKPAPAKPMAPPAVWGVLLLVLFFGFAGFMAVRQSRSRSAEKDAFAAEMDKLAAPPAAGPVKAPPGKVGIMDVGKRERHYLHESDGGDWAEMQAATPAEAAIIVQVRETNREVREYLNGRKGVKQTFHLTVIDNARWTKIAEQTFEGGDPPDSISLKRGGGTNEPVTGAMPTREIRDYLRGPVRG